MHAKPLILGALPLAYALPQHLSGQASLSAGLSTSTLAATHYPGSTIMTTSTGSSVIPGSMVIPMVVAPTVKPSTMYTTVHLPHTTSVAPLSYVSYRPVTTEVPGSTVVLSPVTTVHSVAPTGSVSWSPVTTKAVVSSTVEYEPVTIAASTSIMLPSIVMTALPVPAPSFAFGPQIVNDTEDLVLRPFKLHAIFTDPILRASQNMDNSVIRINETRKDIWIPSLAGPYVGIFDLKHFALRVDDEYWPRDDLYFRTASRKEFNSSLAVMTTNKHKDHLDYLSRAKLTRSRGWFLERDEKDNWYTLKNQENGDFAICASTEFDVKQQSLAFGGKEHWGHNCKAVNLRTSFAKFPTKESLL